MRSRLSFHSLRPGRWLPATPRLVATPWILATLPLLLAAQTDSPKPGIFEGSGDVGTVLKPGSVEFDRASGHYTVAASGENLWGTADAFQFVWKQVSGDVTLTADISFPEAGGDPHKKAVLMVRQSLDPDSAYADVALHGSGLTSLQARESKGAATHEVQSNLSGPRRLRLIKQGDFFYVQLAPQGGEPSMAGGGMKVPLTAPFYVGIGVSAHNKDAFEKAVFANLSVEPAVAKSSRPTLYSTLETVTVASTDRRVTYVSTHHLESPVWNGDATSIDFLEDGSFRRIAVEGGQPRPVPSGTTRPGAVPEKSPDGKYLYFSSDRSGRSQIWRTLADGTAPEQVTDDEWNNFFPHLSPDGTRMVFVSSAKAGSLPPETEDIVLRVLTFESKRVAILAKLIGGRGTMDMSSWSPDGRRLAFVSYQSVR